VAGTAIGSALLAAGLLVGSGMGLAAKGDTRLGGPPIAGQPLLDPPERVARDGLLTTSLTARPSVTEIAGRRVVSGAWESSFPSPTLRVRGGDELKVLQVNRLRGEPTNLHVHGMHVSPAGHGDNVFVNLPSGADFQNRYKIPDDHPPGLYWYHPHRHHYVETQVFAGMAGALIVEGAIDRLPGIRGLRERVMVFQQTEIGPNGRTVRPGRAATDKTLTLINGQLRPTIDIRPGETQRWRIANANADGFLRLRLDGHTFHLIGTDGNPLPRARSVRTMLLAPGERREVLVRGGARGRRTLRTLTWGKAFQKVDPAPLATMVTAGDTATSPPLPTTLLPVEDLRRERVDKRRTVVFSEDFSRAESFLIDGKAFDPDRTDFRVKRGEVEEWTLRNTSTEWHPFHIHVNPFQVTHINGKPVSTVEHEDVVPIPPGGSITMRTRFDDFVGRFVIHCHILFHEDHGMMATVRVVP
jgi:FtsP/CotA-like multicopper oxidase with cupredoxin domain